jgi:hypothetical protein
VREEEGQAQGELEAEGGAMSWSQRIVLTAAATLSLIAVEAPKEIAGIVDVSIANTYKQHVDNHLEITLSGCGDRERAATVDTQGRGA